MIISGCHQFIRAKNGWIVLAELSSGMGDIQGDTLRRMFKTYDTERAAVAFLERT
jgi:hypothetical protein